MLGQNFTIVGWKMSIQDRFLWNKLRLKNWGENSVKKEYWREGWIVCVLSFKEIYIWYKIDYIHLFFHLRYLSFDKCFKKWGMCLCLCGAGCYLRPLMKLERYSQSAIGRWQGLAASHALWVKIFFNNQWKILIIIMANAIAYLGLDELW